MLVIQYLGSSYDNLLKSDTIRQFRLIGSVCTKARGQQQGSDDDLRWVRAVTVPMHLDLIDRSFVPHSLISAQESPVPLPKFQMAPRLKILMSSGSN
jgi:hypothetical protein